MTRRITAICIFSLLALTTPSHAYAPYLHKKIARHAFGQATRESDFLRRYGWSDIPNVLNAFVGFGAVHQDDYARSLNHFYDPQADIPLTVMVPPSIPGGSCIPVGIPAPVWATDARFNPHGLAAAQENFLRALTETSRGDRTYATFSLFEDLGHITHLIQDMAQPEHTRNDQHLFTLDATAPSLYENWTRDHLMSNLLPDGTPTIGFFEGYPTPAILGDTRLYFGSGFQTGLANYSSDNHVTQDTNYSDPIWCAGHPLPVRNERSARLRPAVVTVVDPLTGVGTQVTVVEKIYSHAMFDRNAQRLDRDGHHTILSAIDHEANRYGQRVFSLDDASWHSRAANLVPKAVGYTAAIIKNFFRGKLVTSWTLTPAGTYRITVNVIDFGEYLFEDATAYVYREDHAGNLHELAPPQFLPLVPPTAFIAEVPNAPDPIYKHGLRVIMRGRSGAESGVVVGHVIEPRHEMKLVVEYENGYTYKSTRMFVAGQNELCRGCQTVASWPPTSVHRQLPFSNISTPPFNGRIEFTVGATNDERFVGRLTLEGANEPSRPKTAFITLYRNGVFVRQETIPYTTDVFKEIRFDGAGVFTVRDF